MNRWEVSEIQSKLLKEIDKIENVLNDKKVEVDFISDRLFELKLNTIWIQYLADTIEAPPMDGVTREGMYGRLMGFVSILNSMIDFYIDIINSIEKE